MKTLKFKTNIKCGGCIAAVTPHLNAEAGIQKWEVDTANPDKVLSVESENLTAEQVAAIVKKAGYSAEEVKQ